MIGRAGSQGRRPKKGLENPDVQVRFVASERLFGYFTLGSAAGSNGN